MRLGNNVIGKCTGACEVKEGGRVLPKCWAQVLTDDKVKHILEIKNELLQTGSPGRR